MSPARRGLKPYQLPWSQPVIREARAAYVSSPPLRPTADDREAGSTAFATVARWLLMLIVIASPWFLAGVQEPVRAAISAVVTLALICWLIDRFWCLWYYRSAVRIPALAWLATGGLLILWLQMVPCSEMVVNWLSPQAVRLRNELAAETTLMDQFLQGQPDVGRPAEWNPVSLYPAATRTALVALAQGAGVLLLSATLFRRGSRVKLLGVFLALNGAALAFISIGQRLAGRSLVLADMPADWGIQPFGPFVNQNNAGGYLNLCLAAALAIAVFWFQSPDGSALFRNVRSGRSWFGESRPHYDTGGLGHLLSLPVLVTLLGAGVIGAGVLLSYSRGAVLSMVLGLVAAGIASTFLGRWRTGVLLGTLVVIVAVALVAWVGLSDRVGARLGTLLDLATYDDHSLRQHWVETAGAIGDYWRVGTGLGTYRYVYPLYQKTAFDVRFEHAENVYFETLVETGVPGFLLLIAFIALLVAAAVRLTVRRDSPVAQAVAIGAWFFLISQGLHAACDLAQYVPANFLLTVTASGLLVGLACGGRPHRRDSHERHYASQRSRWLVLLKGAPALAMVLLLTTVNVWGAREAAARWTSAAAREALPDFAAEQLFPAEDLQRGEQRLQSVLQVRPDVAELQLAAARLAIAQFEVQAAAAVSRNVKKPVSAEAVLASVSPVSLHERCQDALRRNRPDMLTALRRDPATQEYLRPAIVHLVLARRACPLLPDSHWLLGALCGLASDPRDDEVHVRRCEQLVPARPDWLWRCGVLDYSSGRVDDAYRLWKRTFTLDLRHFVDVVKLVARRADRDAVMKLLLPDDPQQLISIAGNQNALASQESIRGMALEKALVSLDRDVLPEAESRYLRGCVLEIMKRPQEAVEAMQRAVDLRPLEPVWRYRLATILQQLGRYDEAMLQARLGASLHPGRSEYRTLVLQIQEQNRISRRKS